MITTKTTEEWLWTNESGRTLASYQNPQFRAMRAPRAAWHMVIRVTAIAAGFGTMSAILATIS